MSPRRSLLLCYLAIGLALVVILMGGWTRIMDAGLACPDWPGCFGQLIVPASAEQIAIAEQRFAGIEVDVFKGWIEMTHRYIAASLGVTIFLLAMISWRRRNDSGYPVYLSFALLLLVILQGLFGMWTVTLKLFPPVVTIHLIGGLLTLTLLVLLASKLRQYNRISTGKRSDWRLRLAIMVLFLQVALGGWTSANYAGWACDHWLSCIAEQKDELDFRSGFSLSFTADQNHQGGVLTQPARAAIQMVHRVGAFVVVAAVLLVSLRVFQIRSCRKPAVLLLIVLMLQLLVGGVSVIYGVPVVLAWAHHLGAVLLLLCLLWLKFRYELGVPDG
ncbi:COX15/CtaA family protein [Amphritea japonica]|uniref:Cytochrome c oxidase assembly protein subunit 15 n=1 Tax=Amphritea japonica ATCC BAA-1530 TaxID=1278309 RepID=A0A7R6SUE5_9GAMM|nr:COX15/CtaA family protein [Amphritea japonica]BBB27630.1 cytochrome c oxidase assembly protein subunit 15 [Amphritea japonica ATCC BAA-1530]